MLRFDYIYIAIYNINVPRTEFLFSQLIVLILTGLTTSKPYRRVSKYQSFFLLIAVSVFADKEFF